METIQESVPDGGTINLLFGREPSRVISNSNCITIEPIRTPNVRTIIPLNQVLSVRGCFCRKYRKKHLTCDCINELSTTLSSSLSETSSTSKSRSDKSSLSDSTTDCKSVSGSTPERSIHKSQDSTTDGSGSDTLAGDFKSNGGKIKKAYKTNKYNSSNLKFVRIYYGVAVGEFRWKVTSVSLQLDNGAFRKEARGSKRRNNKSKIEPEEIVVDNNGHQDNEDVEFDSNGNKVNNVLNWISNVSSLIDELKRPKKLLIFINPFGGKKLAPKIYKEKVEPLLKLSGINYSAVITERANHARDMLENVDLPLKDFDGFICIGGDGMFAELINGILIRTQLEQGIDYNSSNCGLVQPSVPIGVIPAGSTDAVAFGVTGINDPITSTIHIIFGNRVDIDVSAIHSINDGDNLIRYATSFLGYGYFGDVLVDSEQNRWMGPSRYDWAGFKKLLAFKRYEGEIKLFTSNVDGSPKDKSVCQSNCTVCERTGQRVKYMKQSMVTSENDNEDVSVVSIKGRFLAVNCATMSCRCDKTKKGMSPSAHLGNGCCDLILVSECSRINYLRFLMRTGFLATSAFDLPFVDVYRVRGFEYYPNDGDTSAWNCDGEVIDQPSLRVKIHCQLLPVYGAGRENRHVSKSGLQSNRKLVGGKSKGNNKIKEGKNLNEMKSKSSGISGSESNQSTGGTNISVTKM